MPEPDIYKAAGIIIQDKKLLHARSHGKDYFIAPGGKLEGDETPAEALIRELKEECSIDVNEADLEPFGEYTAEATGQPGRTVHMVVFTVKRWQGKITPSREIAELRWLTSDIPADIEVGSIFAHEVMPRLKAQGLIA